jgi:hypothetical protein
VIIAALTVVLSSPLIVALVALVHQRWYPLLDLARTEMQLRDVWSSHPPLVGMGGRIGTLRHSGSHPGPLSFYVLWPFYQLFGASPWAMEVSTVVVHTGAIAVLLWIANRRGGPWLVLGLASVVAILLRGLGAALLTQPWNPYLPVLWWLVFLLAVWSVFCNDIIMLPLAALAGSFCAQAHVAYVGLTIGLGLIALGAAGVRARGERHAARQQFTRVALATAGLTILVWIPPVVEQLGASRGNLSVLFDYFFQHPPESPVGLSQGLRVMLAHLNPIEPLTQPLMPTPSGFYLGAGAIVPGLLFAVLWGLTVIAAWRLRLRALLRLDALIGMTIVLGTVSISRISGLLWSHLTLWAWAVNALMLLAVGWAIAGLVGRRLAKDRHRRTEAARRLALAGMVVTLTVLFATRASSVESPAPRLAAQLGAVVNPTVRALEHRVGPLNGRDGRYLVTFRDPNYLGAQGFGLMNELERHGFTVGAMSFYRSSVTPHRVLDPAHATAVLHLAVGPVDITTWRAKPGVEEVAYSDPRSPSQRAEAARLRGQVIAALEEAGLSSRVTEVDENQIGILVDLRVPLQIRLKLSRLDDLGLPIAIFIAPRSVSD